MSRSRSNRILITVEKILHESARYILVELNDRGVWWRKSRIRIRPAGQCVMIEVPQWYFRCKLGHRKAALPRWN